MLFGAGAERSASQATLGFRCSGHVCAAAAQERASRAAVICRSCEYVDVIIATSFAREMARASHQARSMALYEVWMSSGEGMYPGPKFRLLDDARRYVQEHRREASVAVRAPDGHWAVILPRHRMARGTSRP